MPRYKILPKTIDSETETTWPFPQVYVTRREIGLMVIGAMGSMVAAMPITQGINLFSLLVGALAIVGIGQWIKREKDKRNRVQSWLHDLRLEYGMLEKQRTLMRTGSKQYVISAHPHTGPATWASGAKKPGQDLSLSVPWHRQRAPLTLWRPLLIPRRRRSYQFGVKSPAPSWVKLCMENAKVIHPTIPVRIVEQVIPWARHHG